jgi:hypothetical protein
VRRRRPLAVHLYGIVHSEDLNLWPWPPGVHLLAFRAIAAVVADAAPGWRPSVAPDVDAHRAAVGAIFARHSIVPVAPGIVFRERETVISWMELHYGALQDALHYVDGRAEARVHVRAAAGPQSTASGPPSAGTPAGAESIDMVALDMFRDLGRTTAAWTLAPRADPDQSVPDSDSHQETGPGGAGRSDGSAIGASRGRDVADISASFLVDRTVWREFAERVTAEARRDPVLEVVLTGPWPPYDFVRLQFGG